MSEWVYTLLWNAECYLNRSPTLICLAKKKKSKKSLDTVLTVLTKLQNIQALSTLYVFVGWTKSTDLVLYTLSSSLRHFIIIIFFFGGLSIFSTVSKFFSVASTSPAVIRSFFFLYFQILFMRIVPHRTKTTITMCMGTPDQQKVISHLKMIRDIVVWVDGLPCHSCISHKHTRTHARTHANTHTHAHTHTHTHTRAHTRTHTRARARARRHVRTHARMQMHTQISLT